MKAIAWTKYGSYKVLQLQKFKKPYPRSNEVLKLVKGYGGGYHFSGAPIKPVANSPQPLPSQLQLGRILLLSRSERQKLCFEAKQISYLNRWQNSKTERSS